MEEVPVFRAAKRRKFARTKEDRDGNSDESKNMTQNARDQTSANHDGDETQVSTLVKARRQGRARNAGIQFSNSRTTQDSNDQESKAVIPAETAEDRVTDMTSRFIGSTGQVVDVDKHMMAFIDSEMAKRRQNVTAQNKNSIGEENITSGSSESESDVDPTEGEVSLGSKSAKKQGNHQISEVDLGSSASSVNLARTEAAIARARAGLPPLPEQQPKAPRRKKPRLGRDGKPMRPRPRKRRDSADLARDALVEQVLHEHALDVYDKEDTKDGGKAEEQDDERFAEEFRQQFLDAIADRQQKQKAFQGKTSTVTGNVPQGPKLGGGRAGRAMMAAMQAQGNADKGK